MSLASALLLSAATAMGLAGGGPRHEYRSAHMGTTARVVVQEQDEARAAKAAKAAFARIAELEERLSDHRDDSELSRLGRQAGGAAVPVSVDLFAVLLRAQDMARRSGGAFDATCGPLTRLWRQARGRGERPDAMELVAARALVGHRHLELRPAARTARLRLPGMRLDLGGIGRGYAADEALKVLERFGLSRALVELGGVVAAAQAPSGEGGWTVALATLEPEPPLLLKQAAASTSGDAEQWVEIGGTRYSHVLDPRSGEALTGRRSVSVVAENGMLADALATAVGVLGPEAGLRLVEDTAGAAALLFEEGPEGRRRYTSRRWASLPRVSAPKD